MGTRGKLLGGDQDIKIGQRTGGDIRAAPVSRAPRECDGASPSTPEQRRRVRRDEGAHHGLQLSAATKSIRRAGGAAAKHKLGGVAIHTAVLPTAIARCGRPRGAARHACCAWAWRRSPELCLRAEASTWTRRSATASSRSTGGGARRSGGAPCRSRPAWPRCAKGAPRWSSRHLRLQRFSPDGHGDRHPFDAGGLHAHPLCEQVSRPVRRRWRWTTSCAASRSSWRSPCTSDLHTAEAGSRLPRRTADGCRHLPSSCASNSRRSPEISCGVFGKTGVFCGGDVRGHQATCSICGLMITTGRTSRKPSPFRPELREEGRYDRPLVLARAGAAVRRAR